MRKRVGSTRVPAERDLAAAWAQTTGTVTLSSGETVRVVYPGRRNPEAGPDFVDAVLETEEREVRGAVELHRRTSDWQRHGHGGDPNYAGVVLHVVGHDDGAGSRRPGGQQLPLLELAASPGTAGAATAHDALRFPCARALASGRDLLPALEEAGDARFRANVARLRAALVAAPDALAREQIAYEALAEALGYSRNAAPMGELTRAVALAEVRSPKAEVRGLPTPSASGIRLRSELGVMGVTGVEALFLGTAGLLPSQRHLRLGRRRDAYVEVLERLWADQQAAGRAAALRAYQWEMGRVRPENAPVRRVVALAHLALRWPAGGLLAAIGEALGEPCLTARAPSTAAHGARRDDGSVARAASRKLAALARLPCPPGYWAQHWDFGVALKSEARRPKSEVDGGDETTSGFGRRTGEGEGSGDAMALIGPSRAADVVVNVLLPLAAAQGELDGKPGLARSAQAVYEAHPLLAENWITRLVRERTGLLPGGIPGVPPGAGQGDPIHSARAQQGLLAIYEGPCRDLRCGECPLSSDG